MIKELSFVETHALACVNFIYDLYIYICVCVSMYVCVSEGATYPCTIGYIWLVCDVGQT